MKPIFDSNGGDAGPAVRAMLKAKQTIWLADLYHIALIAGGASRTSVGFVARWTDKDYPINSTYLNFNVGPPVQRFATFYPQRMKRGPIETVIGFNVASLDVEVFTNDANSTQSTPISTLASTELSIPSYRDAFSLLTADGTTVVETLKEAVWKGELDQSYFFVYRAFFSDNPELLAMQGQDAEPMGIMPLFIGYIKQSDITRLSVKFQVGALTDVFQTTQTPTQIIENTDRGGQIYVPTTAPPGFQMNALAGSTALKIITDGTVPAGGVVDVQNEQHSIPGSGPFTVTVLNSAFFNTDEGVLFNDGTELIAVGGSPQEGQYHHSGGGVYTFNSADLGRGVLISYSWNDPSPLNYQNGWLRYDYGSYLRRPMQTPVFRQIFNFSTSPGNNIWYLLEPLPVAPLSNGGSGDLVTVFAQTSLSALAANSNGKGFGFLPKPESAL